MTARLDRRWAQIVTATGIPFRPDEFRTLTRGQVDELVAAHNRQHKKR